MYAVSQVVMYSVLFVLMAVKGQDTRNERNHDPQETLLTILQEVRNLNERFDRMEEKVERMENNLNELKTKQNAFKLKMDTMSRSLNSVQGNVNKLSVTSQSNHVDQLNKMEQVATVVQSKNEEVAQSCVNNITRQLLVLSEKISNTTQRACEGCSLLNVANADVTQLYLSFVNVSCHHGYLFNNNQSWIVTQCHDNNTWSPMPGNCTDVDECLVNNGGCRRYATCNNLPGSFTCACKAGFSGNGLTCSDVNECVVNNGGCSQDATCTNLPGSFSCTCKPGFSGNGLTCSDVNECVVNNGGCSQDATCTNLPGSFSCTCKPGFSGNGLTCSAVTVPRDCAEIRALGNTTRGVYTVYLGESQRPLAVYCDMTAHSVGWTVFQRRINGTLDFFRNWRDYQTGFGDIRGEFWLGNDNLHLITSSKRYKLRVELTAFDGETAYAEFDNFTVASAADKYRLTSVGNYSGTAGDSLSWHVGQQFSTKDNDNDQSSSLNCATLYKGAWWYNICARSNLNGFYYQTPSNRYDGGNSVHWYHWKNEMPLKRTEMKLTPFV